MLILEVLPDEIARGYLGRLRMINGFRSPEETVRMLRQYLGERYSGRRGPPVGCLLAEALQMPAEAFSRQHTMLPYIRAVTSHLPDMKHGEAGSEDVIRRSGMSSPKPVVCFCRSCVTEDMDFWGYSYFRRSHQLPGVVYCEKHHEPLLQVADEKAFYSSPHELLERVVPNEITFSVSILEHAAISRFMAITAHWLDADRPVPARQFFEVVRRRSDSLGIRRSMQGKKKLLSDLVLDAMPHDWLASTLPGVLRKRPSEFFQPIDMVVHSANATCRSEAYAVALALLFETAETALNEIDHAIQPAQNKRVARKKHAPGFWRSEEFFKLYIEGRGSPSYIAKKSGRTDENHAAVMMRSVGLPALGNCGDATLRAALDVAVGMNIYEACGRRGARVNAVAKLVAFQSDRFVSAIKAILSKGNDSAATARDVDVEQAA